MSTGERIDLVTVSAYDATAGSARVRIFDWLRHLNLTAYSETYIGGRNNSPRRLLSHPRAVAQAERRLRSLAVDLPAVPLLLSRRASPLSRGRIESLLLGRAARGVFDYDDAIMLPASGARRWLVPQHQVWRRALDSSDVVIAGNDALASYASDAGANVTIIPSCVEPSDYLPRRTRGPRDFPLAVWIGTPATEGYLRNITEPLLTAHHETGLRVRVVSAGSATLGALDPIVDRVEWVRDGFANQLADADFGLMPLDDTPWTRGKCAYKLLQYAAAGLHLIADPVGANARVLQLAGGMTPQGASAWTEALIEAARMSDSQIERSGALARDVVQNYYSFDRWMPAWRASVFG